MISTEHCLNFTDGFHGYLSNQKTTVAIMDCRDASASKKIDGQHFCCHQMLQYGYSSYIRGTSERRKLQRCIGGIILGESTSFMITFDHHTRLGLAFVQSPCENLKVLVTGWLTGAGARDAYASKISGKMDPRLARVGISGSDNTICHRLGESTNTNTAFSHHFIQFQKVASLVFKVTTQHIVKSCWRWLW